MRAAPAHARARAQPERELQDAAPWSPAAGVVVATSSLGRFLSVPVTLLTAPLTQPSECVPHGHSQRGGPGAGRPGVGSEHVAASVMTA